MKVKYKVSVKHNHCTNCDHGRCHLPLDINKEYDVVREEEGFYELMGWGSMKFKANCFETCDNSPIELHPKISLDKLPPSVYN